MPQTMVRQSRSVTGEIVEQLADAAGVGVLDVPPLIESVDPDALEKLFAESDAAEQVSIEFNHAGHRVTVDGGRVAVESLTDGS